MGNINEYLKKKRETARDIKRGIKLGCFDIPGQKKNNQDSSLGNNMRKQRKLLFLRGFFAMFRERSMLTWQFFVI